MGPKKKADDGEDLSIDQFWKNYKKNLASLDTPMCKAVKEQHERYLEDGEPIQKFHIWEQIGWQGVQAVMQSLRTVNYPHTRSIRLWKTHCEDEGVRCVCMYINNCN